MIFALFNFGFSICFFLKASTRGAVRLMTILAPPSNFGLPLPFFFLSFMALSIFLSLITVNFIQLIKACRLFKRLYKINCYLNVLKEGP